MKRYHICSNSLVQTSEPIIVSMTYGMTARVAFGNKCKEHEALITAVREGEEATGCSCICTLKYFM